jgi:DNA polymerase II small subunit
MNKEQTIKYFLDRGVLISPDVLDDEKKLMEMYKSLNKDNKPVVLGKEILSYVNTTGNLDLNVNEFDYAKVLHEKSNSSSVYSRFVNFMGENKATNEIETNTSVIIEEPPEEISKFPSINDSNVNVLFVYDYKTKKKEVSDFVNHFKKRYELIKKMLIARQELSESLSIARLPRKNQGEQASVIGVVLDKSETKNGNIKFTLEDPTGTFNMLVTKNREDMYKLAKDLVLDEVIGVTGTLGNNILFVNNIYHPDIPINHELKKSPDEAYAVFISDIHFGIKNFLHEDFMKFIKWLQGEYGNEKQREIASKIKYLFVVGDIVEGVGIYPGQEEDLEIKDIYAQYEEATRYLKMVPERIKIIICGGNHDALRMSEPQPVFDKIVSKGFYEIPNMIQVTNPALVNIHASEGFPGFNVLMYHGFSFPYYGDQVPSIMEKGGLARCDLIMKFLLQRRHLAPSHSSAQYLPDETDDPMVIKDVPDIFVSGHIHQSTASTYRNVSLINSSCWVVQSEDNAKRGIVPQPGKIPLINLKTREIKIMNFLDDDVKILFNERMGLK